MLDLDYWIARIEAAAIEGVRKVDGAADLGAAEEDTRDTPAIWVIPATETGGENNAANGIVQRVGERVGVVYAVRNRRDDRGRAGHQELLAIRRAVFDGLIGWMPPDARERITFASGRLMRFNKFTLWWQDEFMAATSERHLNPK